MDRIRLPNFFVLGPPRTGTTWLYNCLKEHPQVFLPQIKQLHFFDKKFSKGLDWYKNFFADAKKGHIAIGEITPDYLSNEKACGLIREICGDVKVIVVYRDPVERAFSHYKIRLRSGRYSRDVSFVEALKEDHKLVRDSLYGYNIKRCIALFGRQNVYVAAFEEMKEAPSNYLANILKFLSITNQAKIRPTFLKRRYAESIPKARFQKLDSFLQTIRYYLESTTYGREFAKWLRDIGFVNRIHKVNSVKDETTLSYDLYQKAYSLFLEDLKELRKLNKKHGLISNHFINGGVLK